MAPDSPPASLSQTRATTNGDHAAVPTSSSSPASPPKPKRSLRILCFGDSLTSGYADWGAVSHPYSQRLTTVLSRAFPSLQIQAHVDGCPGDMVNVSSPSSRFLTRIEPKFLTKGGGTPYDWTVILGGTNDLAVGISPEEIYESLKQVWAVPLSKGGRVLACTVPEAWNIEGRMDKTAKRRDELNALIRGHKQENL